jgi:hypothetical protein
MIDEFLKESIPKFINRKIAKPALVVTHLGQQLSPRISLVQDCTHRAFHGRLKEIVSNQSSSVL